MFLLVFCFVFVGLGGPGGGFGAPGGGFSGSRSTTVYYGKNPIKKIHQSFVQKPCAQSCAQSLRTKLAHKA